MGGLYGGAYSPLLHAHCPEAAHTPAVVAQMVLTLSTHDGLPSVYAYQTHDTHQIRTLHRISQASNLPGLASQWDGITFAFAGDVSPPGLVNLVQLPVNPFHLTTAVYAPTAATLNGHWAGAGNTCLGPFQVADADVTITTHQLMPIPYAYVHLMHNHALTPQQAWQQVGEQVIADNHTADCEIFLDFLRAACTYHTPAAPAVGPDTPATAQPVSYTHLTLPTILRV